MLAFVGVPSLSPECGSSSSQPAGRGSHVSPTLVDPQCGANVDALPQQPAQPTSFMPATAPNGETASPTTRGPTPSQLDWDSKHGLILECKNLSSLESYWQVFADRKASVPLLQELSCSTAQLQRIKAELKKRNRGFAGTKVDPHCNSPTGGSVPFGMKVAVSSKCLPSP